MRIPTPWNASTGTPSRSSFGSCEVSRPAPPPVWLAAQRRSEFLDPPRLHLRFRLSFGSRRREIPLPAQSGRSEPIHAHPSQQEPTQWLVQSHGKPPSPRHFSFCAPFLSPA